MIKTISLLVLISVILPIRALATPHSSVCGPQMLLTYDMKKTYFTDIGKAIEDSVGFRGLVYKLNRLPKGPEAEAEAAKHGMFYWRQNIYLVKSKAEAEAHVQLEPNLGNKGMYIVTDVNLDEIFKEADVSKISNEEVKKVFASLFAGGQVKMFEPDDSINPEDYVKPTFDKDKKLIPGTKINLVRVDPKKALEIYLPDNVAISTEVERSTVLPDGSYGPAPKFFFHYGWHAPKYHGVMMVQDVLKSTEHRDIMRFILKFMAAKYNFVFNGNLDETFNLLAVQDRRRHHFETDAVLLVDPSANRYPLKDKKENIASELKKLANLTGFSGQVLDPNGKVISGHIANQEGPAVTPETVFGDRNWKPSPESGINPKTPIVDAQKMIMTALVIRAMFAGLPYVDAGMVTPLTAQLGATYIRRADYEALRLAVTSSSYLFLDLRNPLTREEVELALALVSPPDTSKKKKKNP